MSGAGIALRDPNSELLRILGITQKHVVSADISLRVDHFPLVKLECIPNFPVMDHLTSTYMLVPVGDESTPLPSVPAPDLDDMADRAREAVRRTVNGAANRALAEMNKASLATQYQVRDAIYVWGHSTRLALARLELRASPVPHPIDTGRPVVLALDDRRAKPRAGARP